jgi:hypothetical protein
VSLAQRRLSIPFMTPLVSRDQAKLQPKYASGARWPVGCYRHGRARRNFVVGSWNDLATADTPEFLNSKAGEILSTSLPINSK